ncbi:MAG: hypothetical protein IAF38_06870 [Bacteroidia bacterium]|nr:hypothetical protein [Bacteroidia bacterium]
MHFEENEIRESSNPRTGTKIILRCSSTLGILFTGFMTIYIVFNFGTLTQFNYRKIAVISTLMQMLPLYISALSITYGSIKMRQGMEKGWGSLFFGSFVFVSFFATSIGSNLEKFISTSPDHPIWEMLLKILVLLIFIFFGSVAIWLLSPAIRKFPDQKKIFLSFSLSAVASLLTLGGFLIQKFYLQSF